MKLGSLFSGIGGFELGLERAIPGLETVWQVEQVEFCQKVLQKHWPNAKIYDDVRNINKNNVEPIDILCGGFPCQDISLAGKGEGINGKKSGLWWEMHRIISELRPRIAIMENVPAITFRGLDTVLGSLSQIGYDAEWTIISAAQFGAPHLRKRWFCVAYPHGQRSRQTRNWGTSPKNCTGENVFRWRSQKEESSNPNGTSVQGEWIPSGIQQKNTDPDMSFQNYWGQFPSQPPLRDRNDGVPNRLARLRALGNAIVPQCSQWIGEQILNSGLLEELK
jgi:DNA (cytosine-5)-methyltransferase 1